MNRITFEYHYCCYAGTGVLSLLAFRGLNARAGGVPQKWLNNRSYRNNHCISTGFTANLVIKSEIWLLFSVVFPPGKMSSLAMIDQQECRSVAMITEDVLDNRSNTCRHRSDSSVCSAIQSQSSRSSTRFLCSSKSPKAIYSTS